MTEPLDGFPLAALLLVAGGVALVALVGPTAFVPPAIWNGPREVALRLISAHSVTWRVANIGFVLATVFTAAGLFLAPGSVGARGEALALAAAVVFLLAAVPWLLMLAVRLAVTPAVASRFVADGTVDPSFDTIEKLGDALFPAFILLSSGSIVALGAAVVAGGTLDAWAGWACAGAGVAIAASLVTFGDTLPAFVYLPTAGVGVVLLLSGR